MDALLSVENTAKRLGCTEAMLKKWINQRKLPTVKVGRLTRARQADVEAWIRPGLQPMKKEGGKEAMSRRCLSGITVEVKA